MDGTGQQQPGSQQRMMIALLLSFVLIVAYSFYQSKFGPKQPVSLAADGGAAVATTNSGDGGVVVAAQAPSNGAPAIAPAPTEPPKTFARDLKQIHYLFTNDGAGLVKAELQGPKEREQQQVGVGEGLGRLIGHKIPPPPQMDMATAVADQPVPLGVSIDGAAPFAANSRYAVDESKDNELKFTAQNGTWEVTKTFTLAADGYEMLYRLDVKNVGAAAANGEVGVHYARKIDPENEHARSFFGGVGNQSAVACAMAGESPKRRLPTDKGPAACNAKTDCDKEENCVHGACLPEEIGKVRWFGIDQQYFVAAVYPLKAPADGRCVLDARKDGRMITAYFPISLGPGAIWSQTYGIYIGPKDTDLLEKVPTAVIASADTRAEPLKLEDAVDYGWWAVICKVMLPILKFFHSIIHNWGVAIILLTVTVKLAMLPLTHKQYVQAEQMKKLQPKMEEIKKKYPEDKERQNLEMMKMYQENKVNPLGGCFPLLLQFPIWGALFQTLRTSYDLYGEPFINPIWADLTYKDPTYILPLALGVTMFITQRLQPQMMDAAQAKLMTWFMPIFFTAMMFNYPAGLSLYIFSNNILSIAQQQLLRRYLARTGQLAPPKGSAGSQEKGSKSEKDTKKNKKAKKAEAT